MSAQRFAEFTVADDADCATGVNLLAHEDVALKAYFETRRRYLGDLPAAAAFNQIGEVLPTILLNGRVVGTWTWDPTAKRARHRLIPVSCHPPNTRRFGRPPPDSHPSCAQA
ncbi:DNA glycosylase AlkZ-like family protein [Nonomuraea dietziae]|uniref:DNA glycosylase AlkZ-like family protein n=1 Tax=Nonomuraea dietziae TaxID=65515 RepID=UPI0031E41305